MSRLNAVLASAMIGTSLIGMPVQAWEQETTQQECVPQFSVDYESTHRVIVVDQQNSCEVSSQLYILLLDENWREFRLIAHQSRNYSGRWVTQVNPVAQGGLYRVSGVEYLNGQVAPPLDQRITIPGTQGQEQVVLPPAPRQEMSPQRPEVSLDAESKRLLHEILDILQWFKEAFLRFQASLTQMS